MGEGSVDEPDIWDVVHAFKDAFGEVAADAGAALRKFQDEAEYRIDKAIGRELAKHPDLYADLKRGYKKFRRGLDQAAKDVGLR